MSSSTVNVPLYTSGAQFSGPEISIVGASSAGVPVITAPSSAAPSVMPTSGVITQASQPVTLEQININLQAASAAGITPEQHLMTMKTEEIELLMRGTPNSLPPALYASLMPLQEAAKRAMEASITPAQIDAVFVAYGAYAGQTAEQVRANYAIVRERAASAASAANRSPITLAEYATQTWVALEKATGKMGRAGLPFRISSASSTMPTSAVISSSSAPTMTTSAVTSSSSAPTMPTSAVTQSSVPIMPTSAIIEAPSAPMTSSSAIIEAPSAPIMPTSAIIEAPSSPIMPTSAITQAPSMPTSAITQSSAPIMATSGATEASSASLIPDASAPTLTSGPSVTMLEQITSILAPITEKLDDLISRLDVLQTSADATSGILETLSTATTYGGGKTRRRRR